MRRAPILRPLAVLLASLSLSACGTLSPDLTLPAAPVPERFAAAPATTAGASKVDEIAWRDYFTDARLREVIALALAHNRDLRIATLNIERARAQYGIQRAELFPSITLGAGQTAQRLPADLTPRGEATISRQYSVDLGFAAYELDFFGRVRSLQEQALQSYLASEAAQRSAQISLIAEVANTWLRLAADRERLALAERTLDTRQRSLELIRRSFEVGSVSALDVHQAESLLETARADVARYRSLVMQDQNALALLAGTTLPASLQPEALDERVGSLAELPAGLPAEVLTRRPDIVQAEHALRAANASIGAARAAFFPSISLTASAGTASASLDGLFDSGSRAWRFVPQLRLPIFEAGRLQASLDLAEIQRDIQIAQYEKAIQTAFREVSDLLAERSTLGEQLDARRKRVAATTASLRLAEARYRSGIDSYLGLLDAQRERYAAEQELITIRQAALSNQVTLYKALGGGWQ